MACPFVRRSDSLSRQASVADHGNWGIEDDISEIPDALQLAHLQAAIKLLTAPSVSALCFSLFYSLLPLANRS